MIHVLPYQAGQKLNWHLSLIGNNSNNCSLCTLNNCTIAYIVHKKNNLVVYSMSEERGAFVNKGGKWYKLKTNLVSSMTMHIDQATHKRSHILLKLKSF